MTAHLLFDSISRNTGDIAIGIAGQQALAARGIESDIVDPFDAFDAGPLIVGGGELIRDAGDDLYDRYRRVGGHILNAAGVWTSSQDLGYLRDYRFVSARSQVEVDHLRTWVPDARLLPCTTTILESPHFEIEGIEPDEPVVGIHVVPHTLRLIENMTEIINAIPHKKVFIPFTHYNSDASFMKSMPFDWSNSVVLPNLAPLELHSVLGQMSYVIVSSLHASIFAYSQGVGFGSIHQTKAADYFEDRGLADFIIRDERGFREVIDRLENGGFDAADQVTSDAAAVNAAYDEYATILGEAVGTGSIPSELTAALELSHDHVLLNQATRVVADRDLALSLVERRRQAAAEQAKIALLDRDRLAAQINALNRIWWIRTGLAARRRLGVARRRLLSGLKRARGNRR